MNPRPRARIRPNVRVHPRTRQKGLPKRQSTGLLIIVYDLLALLFGLSGLVNWFGSLYNNPLMLHQSKLASLFKMIRPTPLIIITALVIIIPLILSYQNVYKSATLTGIAMTVTFVNIAYLLSFRFYGTAEISLILFNLAAMVITNSVFIIKHGLEVLTSKKSYYWSFGLGTVYYLIFDYMFRLGIKPLIVNELCMAIVLVMLYLSRNELSKAREINKANAINNLAHLPLYAFKALKNR